MELDTRIELCEKRLEQRAKIALEILAPIFGVGTEYHGFRPLSYQVHAMPKLEKGFYHKRSNSILAHFSSVDDPLTTGEEVSHYLHNNINPLDRPHDGGYALSYFRVVSARETVGRYGALSYLKAAGEPIPRNGHLKLKSREMGAVLDWLAHRYGYNRAEMLFADHGTRMLPRVARMSVDEMDKIHFVVSPEEFFRINLRDIPNINDWLTHPLDPS
jgi:hypothetical protein